MVYTCIMHCDGLPYGKVFGHDVQKNDPGRLDMTPRAEGGSTKARSCLLDLQLQLSTQGLKLILQ